MAFGQAQGLPLRRRAGERQPWLPAMEDLEPVAGQVWDRAQRVASEKNKYVDVSVL